MCFSNIFQNNCNFLTEEGVKYLICKYILYWLRDSFNTKRTRKQLMSNKLSQVDWLVNLFILYFKLKQVQDFDEEEIAMCKFYV